MTKNVITILTIIMVSQSSCSILFSRKTSDTIKNPQAIELFRNALEQRSKGKDGFQNSIDLFDKADSIEPKNAVIIHERGLVKFNSKIDVKGAFIDLKKSIDYSTDEKDLLYRYNNRGLCYMEICDIKSACSDWEKAGKSGKSYLEKYCEIYSDSKFQNNRDMKIELDFNLIDSISKIISTHNSPSMSECNANIKINNVNNNDLKILGSRLDYGFPEDSSSLYLEAQSQDGEKFIFFTKTNFSNYPSNKEVVIKKGESYSQYQNITFLHQFPYSGIYKVRVAIRPSRIFQGIESTYYSNWQTLKVED